MTNNIKERLRTEYVKAVNNTIDREVSIDEYIALLERESKELNISFEEALDSDQDFELINR